MIWLASASPRRRQLLTWAGFDVEVHPTDVDESWIVGEHPEDAAERLAVAKCIGPANRRVLAADTVVHLDERAFGKPGQPEQARAFLKMLSGCWHQVTTGVATKQNGHLRSLRITTSVRFRTLDDATIDRYIQTGEPLDKAGAYAIQGIGGALVAEVQGSWTNVMGLPLEATIELLATGKTS